MYTSWAASAFSRADAVANAPPGRMAEASLSWAAAANNRLSVAVT